MIRVQPTTSGGYRFLIGSDLRDPMEAQREVEEWVAENNCVLPRNARHLSVFERGVLVREWVLVERNPETVSMPTPVGGHETPLWQQLRQRIMPNASPIKDNVVALNSTAA